MRIIYVINGLGLSDEMGESAVRSGEVAKPIQAQGYTIFFVTTLGGLKVFRREKPKAKYHVLPSSIWTQRAQGLFERFLGYVISTLAFPFMLPRLSEVIKSSTLYYAGEFICPLSNIC